MANFVLLSRDKKEPNFDFFKNSKGNWDLKSSLSLVSSENDEIKSSALLLAASSRYLEKILLSASIDKYEGPHSVLLPDFNSSSIYHFIQLLNKGEITLASKDELHRIQELLSLLCLHGDHEVSLVSQNNSYKLQEESRCSEDEDAEDKSRRDCKPKKMGPSRKMWKCHLCNKKFWKLESIQAHLRIHQGLKPYKCELCYKEFKQESSFMEHKRLHSDSSALTCEFCGKTFASSSGLKTHIDIIHVGVERKFDCHFCQAKFKTKGALTVHITTHSDSKNFVCDTCGFQTTSKSLLHNHQFVHKKVKKYQCAMCPKSFNFKHSIDTHLRRHLGEKPFPCSQCEQSFCSNIQLKSHIKKVHTTTRSFVCKICSANFKTKQDASRHLILHSDAKPFQCTECGAAFKHREAGRRHIKSTHNGSKTISLHYVPTESLNELQNCALLNVELLARTDANNPGGNINGESGIISPIAHQPISNSEDSLVGKKIWSKF